MTVQQIQSIHINDVKQETEKSFNNILIEIVENTISMEDVDESISLLSFNKSDEVNLLDTKYKISHPWNLFVAGESVLIEPTSDVRIKLEEALAKVDLKISEESTSISEQQILDYQSISRDTVVDFILNEMSKVDNKDKAQLELFSNLISGQQQIPKEIVKTTNITPDLNLNKSIYIKEVNMNFNTMLTDLHIIAIPNDMYYVRVAEDESVVNYFEETIAKYTQEQNPMKISFKKGHRYTLTLFDRYNTPVDVWTFLSDRDFSYSNQAVTLIQKAPLPITLPKTSDFNFGGTIILVIVLILILAVKLIYMLHKLNTH